MKMVVLDGNTLNPGDLDWSGLEELGECRVYPATPPGEVVDRASGAQIAIINKVVFDRATLERLPALRYIGVTATGYNVVDVVAAREREIVVTNVPTYGTASVAQTAFALLLELTQHAGEHSRAVRSGKWSRCADFCFWDFPLVELEGLTLGLVGLGRIGRKVAEVGRAFGMRVAAFDAVAGIPAGSGIEAVSMDELFRTADVISLHCPLTPDTERLVNRQRLATVKKSAFLINTARGGLVDEAALAEALNAGWLAGAGLDVLGREPPPPDNPLLAARNCVITPHIAWATLAARRRLMEITVENVRAFLKGEPRNVVS
jgi:glycerate dehydrogenase